MDSGEITLKPDKSGTHLNLIQLDCKYILNKTGFTIVMARISIERNGILGLGT